MRRRVIFDVLISDVVREAAEDTSSLLDHASVSPDVQLSLYRHVCPAITSASLRTAPRPQDVSLQRWLPPKSYFISCWIQQIVAKRTRLFYPPKNKRVLHLHGIVKQQQLSHFQKINTVALTYINENARAHTHTHTQIKEGTRYISPIVWDDKI